jgi:hypothetical protein
MIGAKRPLTLREHAGEQFVGLLTASLPRQEPCERVLRGHRVEALRAEADRMGEETLDLPLLPTLRDPPCLWVRMFQSGSLTAAPAPGAADTEPDLEI